MKRAVVFLLFFSWITSVFAQDARKDSALIKQRFSKIVYQHNSSVIESAWNERHGKPEGYGIVFSDSGKPVMIGKFKKGYREGLWLRSDGSSWKYERGKITGGSRPGCGTGIIRAQEEFKLLYEELLK